MYSKARTQVKKLPKIAAACKEKRRVEEFRPAQPWIPANFALSRRKLHLMVPKTGVLFSIGHL
jgi:hypothetical protein